MNRIRCLDNRTRCLFAAFTVVIITCLILVLGLWPKHYPQYSFVEERINTFMFANGFQLETEEHNDRPFIKSRGRNRLWNALIEDYVSSPHNGAGDKARGNVLIYRSTNGQELRVAIDFKRTAVYNVTLITTSSDTKEFAMLQSWLRASNIEIKLEVEVAN